MFLKVLIISVILLAIVLLALGVKLFFKPKAEFGGYACAFDFQNGLDENSGCLKCQLKDLANCPEDMNNKEMIKKLKSQNH
ncbi:hypothetical protein [Geofilum rubicundum]|uniref:Membrane or secreted protein n=1 Tax=Geofilum rubicundum JCM 15548 TaxID=1236989 RepID=A0A0E9LYN6_9BACT|nr:hypothetical protein [Geofilum rubicundum]GAO30393.1 hypothetical protein JCM15548_12658 [Geofilum rubicundum JCM 15548]